MEFHKPKPVHNWRDLFKEIGIIVIGVSIALAAEQMVEYFHWRNEVSIARKALQDEIISIDRFYIRRIGLAPCEAKQEQEGDRSPYVHLDGVNDREYEVDRKTQFQQW